MLFHYTTSSLAYLRRSRGVFGIRELSSWSNNVSRSTCKVQHYLSRTSDPFLNLSFEQYLLEKTPPDSAILFLYVNRPCIVIGRNQNPWLEVNLNILDAVTNSNLQTEPPALGNIDLVRRRSGGGAVFHDEGNVNWTVICPSADFTRDKHAEMVVRALRGNGVERARVNERHDVVLDRGSTRVTADASDFHRTPYTVDQPGNDLRPVKVSGSAYKLTRGRALHHGTCLLSSPNLQIIPHYLHAPGKPYIKAKGVESVSSPVGNIGVDISVFKAAMRTEFAKLYASGGQPDIEETVGDELLEEPPVRKLWDEMQTPDWIFGQTPQFTFSSHPIPEDDRPRPGMPAGMPASAQIRMDFKHGQIMNSAVSLAQEAETATEAERLFQKATNGRRLYDANWSWSQAVEQMEVGDAMQGALSAWLEALLPLSVFKRLR